MEGATEEKFTDWKDRLIHNQLDDHEIKAIQHLPEYQEVKSLLEAGKDIKIPAYSEHDAWNTLSGVIKHPETRIKNLLRNRKGLFLIGILFMTLFSMGIWWLQGREETFSTGPKENESITWSNGSAIHLHVVTTLVVKPKLPGRRQRQVRLSGQAYFNLTTDYPLEVTFPLGFALLSTGVFDLRTRNGLPEATCYFGHMDLSIKKKNIRVEAGQKAIWAADNWVIQPIPDQIAQPAWLDGSTNYQNATLDYIISELELLYGVTIDLNATREQTFSGSLPNYDLAGAIAQMEKTFQLKADYFPGNLIILDGLPATKE